MTRLFVEKTSSSGITSLVPFNGTLEELLELCKSSSTHKGFSLVDGPCDDFGKNVLVNVLDSNHKKWIMFAE